MKPFNLDAALNGAAVVTRDGRKVTEIHYFKTLTKPHVLACIIDNVLLMHLKDGRAYSFDKESENDLFMAPIKLKKWINIYYQGNGYSASMAIYDSKEEAIEDKSEYLKYISTIEIEFEDDN